MYAALVISRRLLRFGRPVVTIQVVYGLRALQHTRYLSAAVLGRRMALAWCLQWVAGIKKTEH